MKDLAPIEDAMRRFTRAERTIERRFVHSHPLARSVAPDIGPRTQPRL